MGWKAISLHRRECWKLDVITFLVVTSYGGLISKKIGKNSGKVISGYLEAEPPKLLMSIHCSSYSVAGVKRRSVWNVTRGGDEKLNGFLQSRHTAKSPTKNFLILFTWWGTGRNLIRNIRRRFISSKIQCTHISNKAQQRHLKRLEEWMCKWD